MLIRSIDLVKVEPVQASRLRWMRLSRNSCRSPAAASRWAAPMETPTKLRLTRHVSGFAIGKTDVTNEQFERFDPTHHAVRDGYSWRNADPVIYVSWPDAARYCNALSKAQGLTPAYDEKTWEAARERRRLSIADRGAVGICRHGTWRRSQLSMGQ